MKNKLILTSTLAATIAISLSSCSRSHHNPVPQVEATPQLNSQVIFGDRTSIEKRPYQAAIMLWGGGNYYYQICAGTVISDQWVLTAAHCLGKGRRFIRVGSTNSYYGGEVIEVAEKHAHPDYSSGYGKTVYADIALLKLKRPIRNSIAKAALLPTPRQDSITAAVGQPLVLSGWGRTEVDDPRSGSIVLREADLPVIDNLECARILSKLTNKQVVFNNGTICGGLNERQQTGCHGDSGGPLAQKVNGKFYVFGVVSWGRSQICNGPTAFMRVSHFLPWIKSVVGSNL